MGSNYLPNILAMGLAVNQSFAGWSYNNGGANLDLMSGMRNDRGVQMMGGAGDPFGMWEVLGMALSASDNSNMQLAALPLLIVTKNGDDALKMLAAENGLLKAEARAAKLSLKERPGKDFTKAGKESVKDLESV
ncbi:hypothetical protein IQ37_19740 [Chryseobacterium piperi]|uniref:Uncharacterized protein n=1 Tax=Chryseobacterium piperi TaxID=558152 RepID=A0A085ZZN8_9FLAO|nr:hypothetical protein [Chryseobacterium piperi]ASW73699.1 hypothetical protein CJF12_04930 [Chryseobacterium piperi]KFF09902.1 hypothetical protein IQ37_19740 [Chryseobacterium piperi]